MIRRIRQRKGSLATCGLSLAGVHVALLFVSVLLHGPPEDHGGSIAGLPAPFHHHDFRIASGSAAQRGPAPCFGCLLERYPAWTVELAEALPVSRPMPRPVREPGFDPTSGLSFSSSPRAPPLA